jgi:hypothetical protein
MRTDEEYQAAADWAEHKMDLSKATGGTVLHGAAAAAHGRQMLEQAAGGAAELDRMVRGRPSIDPDAGPGEHSATRQVRLPAATNQQLDALATEQGRTVSAIMRDALTDYFAAHRAG